MQAELPEWVKGKLLRGTNHFLPSQRFKNEFPVISAILYAKGGAADCLKTGLLVARSSETTFCLRSSVSIVFSNKMGERRE